MKKLPEVVQAKEDELTKLEVQVFGKPKPKTKWLHEGKPIKPSEIYDIQNFSDGTSVLFIHNAKPENIGKITFEAHNSVGVAESSTELITEGTLYLIIFIDLYIFFQDNQNILQKFLQVFETAVSFPKIYLSHLLHSIYLPKYNDFIFQQKYTKSHIPTYVIVYVYIYFYRCFNFIFNRNCGYQRIQKAGMGYTNGRNAGSFKRYVTQISTY